MILDAVGENRGVQVEFYNRFQYTVEVSGRSVRYDFFIFYLVIRMNFFDFLSLD